MKRITDEGEPVVLVPLVVEPVEVGLALRLVPPNVRDLLLALEGSVRNITHNTVL